MRFSAPVKKHWLGSFSIVLPPLVCGGSFRLCGTAREQGRPGPGGTIVGGGGGPGTHIPLCPASPQALFVTFSASYTIRSFVAPVLEPLAEEKYLQCPSFMIPWWWLVVTLLLLVVRGFSHSCDRQCFFVSTAILCLHLLFHFCPHCYHALD